MGASEGVEAITSASYRTPKTVLGFFAIIVGLVIAGASTVIAVFSRQTDLYALIVPVLVFVGFVVLAVLGGIFVTAWKDPTILMLGQVTGDIYIQNRRLTLGDSTAGEFTEEIAPMGDQMKVLQPMASSLDESDGT
jgi:hypothetical protein